MVPSPPSHFHFLFISSSFLKSTKENPFHSSRPSPILPVPIVVHESEGFRLSNVCGALEEVNGLTYPVPHVYIQHSWSVSPFLSLKDSPSQSGRRIKWLLLSITFLLSLYFIPFPFLPTNIVETLEQDRLSGVGSTQGD